MHITKSLAASNALTVAIMTALAGGSVRAQASESAPEPRTMSTIRVQDAVDEEASYAPKRSSTATKTDTPLIETPQSVSIVTAVEMRDQSSPNLQEALRYTPGVRNELYGIDNRGDWFALRGSEESTTFLDGMRLPLTGWYGVVRMEPYNYERIEVLRGPSSIIAGAMDPGGVLNLVSKRPQETALSEISLQAGNYSLMQVGIDSTGPLTQSGDWLYRFVAMTKESDTQIDHADEERTLIAPSVTWRPNESADITVYGEYQYDRSNNTNAFLGLEGTLYPAPNGPIPRDLFIGEPDWDTYGGTRYRLGTAMNFWLSDAWELRFNARHDDVEGLMESMYAAWWAGFFDANGAPDPNGEYMGRPWYIYDDSSQITTAEVLMQADLATGGVQHTLLFGFDGLVQDGSQTSASGDGTLLNVYNPVYGTFDRPSITTELPVDNEIRRYGALIQDQMKIGERWNIRAGLRRDKVSNAASGAETETDWATTGNIGVVFEVVPGLAPYASYSQSFNPVAGTDAQGNTFEPKRAEQIEAGIKWESQSIPLQAAAAFYAIEEENRLTEDPNNFGFSVQLGKARVRGAELEVQGEVASFDLIGSYTYTRVRANAPAWGGTINEDEQLEGIPESQASLWAVYDFANVGLQGFRLGGGVRYIDRIGDGTGNVFVPSVTLFDVMASYDMNSWRFALNANNVTDKDYIATCLARGDCWFGQARRIVGSVSYRW